jgi:hypothetical protein
VQAELKQGVDKIYSTHYAFAAKMQDGSVVTWGSPMSGGDSSRVQAELKQKAELKQGVDTIYSTDDAFAALMQDGSVVTWGDPVNGGDSSGVQAELKQGVDTIYSTYYAFAVKMQDGSVVTWGDAKYGGEYPDYVGCPASHPDMLNPPCGVSERERTKLMRKYTRKLHPDKNVKCRERAEEAMKALYNRCGYGQRANRGDDINPQ